MSDWASIDSAIDRIVAESQQAFDADTVAQVRDFIALIRNHCPVAPEIAKGYWPTFCVGWGPNSEPEFEIFCDRIEVYRFPPGHVHVRYFDHAPGAPWPSDLIAELPTLRISN